MQTQRVTEYESETFIRGMRDISRPKGKGKVEPKPLGVVGQVKLAFQPRNRVASLIGSLIGGAIPVASYQLAHHEIVSDGLLTQPTFYMVLGGLLFSALTVYQWARVAFGSATKAVGFTVLLEGVLTLSHTPWLSVGALVYLCAINAVATGVKLSKGG